MVTGHICLTILLDKVLLEKSYTHSFTYCLWLLLPQRQIRAVTTGTLQTLGLKYYLALFYQQKKKRKGKEKVC